MPRVAQDKKKKKRNRKKKKYLETFQSNIWRETQSDGLCKQHPIAYWASFVQKKSTLNYNFIFSLDISYQEHMYTCHNNVLI